MRSSHRGQGQDDRVKSIFRSIDCKPPTSDVAEMDIFMSPQFDIATIRVAAKSPTILAVFMTIIEWSVDTQIVLPIPVAFKF